MIAGFISSVQLEPQKTVSSQLGSTCCKNYKEFIDSSGGTLAGYQMNRAKKHKNKDGSGCVSDFSTGASVKQDVASAAVETPAFFTRPCLWRV